MSLKHTIAPFSAWLQAVSKPFTEPASAGPRPGAPRYRGWHINDRETCIGCGTCADICQNVAIDMVVVDEPAKGDSGLRPKVDYGRCCWCALCVDVCPSGSLGMSNEYVWTDADGDVFRYTPGVDEKPWDGSEDGWRKESGFDIIDHERVEMPKGWQSYDAVKMKLFDFYITEEDKDLGNERTARQATAQSRAQKAHPRTFHKLPGTADGGRSEEGPD